MEVLQRLPSTNRVTLRLPNQVLEILKEETEKKDLTLNALVTKILFKNISFDLHVKVMPNITIPPEIFIEFINKSEKSTIEEIAKNGPALVKKLFRILGVEYELDNVINNYFGMVGKYCELYSFSHQIKHNRYRLVFNTVLGPKWTIFLSIYAEAILKSLRILVDEVSVNDGVIVFEFSKKVV